MTQVSGRATASARRVVRTRRCIAVVIEGGYWEGIYRHERGSVRIPEITGVGLGEEAGQERMRRGCTRRGSRLGVVRLFMPTR